MVAVREKPAATARAISSSDGRSALAPHRRWDGCCVSRVLPSDLRHATTALVVLIILRIPRPRAKTAATCSRAGRTRSIAAVALGPLGSRLTQRQCARVPAPSGMTPRRPLTHRDARPPLHAAPKLHGQPGGARTGLRGHNPTHQTKEGTCDQVGKGRWGTERDKALDARAATPGEGGARGWRYPSRAPLQ